MLGFQNDILLRVAKGEPINETAAQLCLAIERFHPGVICSVLSVDVAGLMHLVAAPSLPDEFTSLLDGMLFGPYVGSCGSAAYHRRRVDVRDIEDDPRWSRHRALTLAIGLTGCYSVPLYDAEGAPIGVVALYFRDRNNSYETPDAKVEACIELSQIALRAHGRVAGRDRRAYVDALTGLANRTAFNAALSSVHCDEPGAWALFLVDLDNLKVVNDTFGHRAGDVLIATVSQRIAEVMAPDVAFRLGGDEFAILIQNPDALRDLDQTAGRIFVALEGTASCDGHTMVPKATIGGAVLGPGETDANTVKQNADFALYHAKDTGRGGFVRYWPGIGTKITHRRDAIRDVTAARRDVRIDAYYQPIIRLDSREIVGVEALCRMRTPDGVVVPAAAFRDATADAHVASKLTARMLSIVARDMRGWIDEGLALRNVSVNISTADLYMGKLAEQLAASFRAGGVPLDCLILDVAEDVYMGQRDRVAAQEVKALRSRGLRVALDNFGTGYASLTHLVTMPVDIIKIDRSFVARLCPGDPNKAIVEGVLDIARKLDIKVVAEGIESEDQASYLWSMGCRLGQGFAFSKAVDRTVAATLLRRHASGADGATPLYPVAEPAPFSMPSLAELQPTGTG